MSRTLFAVSDQLFFNVLYNKRPLPTICSSRTMSKDFPSSFNVSRLFKLIENGQVEIFQSFELCLYSYDQR